MIISCDQNRHFFEILTKKSESYNAYIEELGPSLALLSSIIIPKTKNCVLDQVKNLNSKNCTWGATPKIA